MRVSEPSADQIVISFNKLPTEPNQATANASQRCIEPDCRRQYALDERLYVCPGCGGLLDIEKERDSSLNGEMLRGVWRERLLSFEARDRSGVWRYRELLPFESDAPLITLAEGNTPLYDAPRSASY